MKVEVAVGGQSSRIKVSAVEQLCYDFKYSWGSEKGNERLRVLIEEQKQAGAHAINCLFIPPLTYFWNYVHLIFDVIANLLV